jgi:hypothetical protein
MFDDIKELIDQAAPQPNQTHRDELWQQFQNDAQVTTGAASTASRPTTVLRPPAPLPPKPSDTIILEKIVPFDELDKRRNHRRLYSVLAVAAAVVTVAGIAAVSRNGKTVQVSPAAPTSTLVNGDETSTAPATPASTEVTTTEATVATTTATTAKPLPSTAPPKTTPAPTVAPVTTPATTAPKPVTTVGAPATNLVTVLAPDYAETMTAIGGWDGENFVTLPTKIAPGPYQALDGQKFEVEIAKPYGQARVQVQATTNADDRGISFSSTSWSAQPRPARSQGDSEALKDARFNIYREEASRLAKELGGANVMPALSSVVRSDLDGDGADEVLVAASYMDIGGLQGLEPAKIGSFSIVYVRQVVGNTATSKVISAVVAKDAPSILPSFWIDGAVDLNGDGVMEVLGSGGLWEWANYYCWDAGSADRSPKTLFSFVAPE